MQTLTSQYFCFLVFLCLQALKHIVNGLQLFMWVRVHTGRKKKNNVVYVHSHTCRSHTHTHTHGFVIQSNILPVIVASNNSLVCGVLWYKNNYYYRTPQRVYGTAVCCVAWFTRLLLLLLLPPRSSRSYSTSNTIMYLGVMVYSHPPCTLISALRYYTLT